MARSSCRPPGRTSIYWPRFGSLSLWGIAKSVADEDAVACCLDPSRRGSDRAVVGELVALFARTQGRDARRRRATLYRIVKSHLGDPSKSIAKRLAFAFSQLTRPKRRHAFVRCLAAALETCYPRDETRHLEVIARCEVELFKANLGSQGHNQTPQSPSMMTWTSVSSDIAMKVKPKPQFPRANYPRDSWGRGIDLGRSSSMVVRTSPSSNGSVKNVTSGSESSSDDDPEETKGFRRTRVTQAGVVLFR